MKKILTLVSAAAIAVSFSACGDNQDGGAPAPAAPQATHPAENSGTTTVTTGTDGGTVDNSGNGGMITKKGDEGNYTAELSVMDPIHGNVKGDAHFTIQDGKFVAHAEMDGLNSTKPVLLAIHSSMECPKGNPEPIKDGKPAPYHDDVLIALNGNMSSAAGTKDFKMADAKGHYAYENSVAWDALMADLQAQANATDTTYTKLSGKTLDLEGRTVILEGDADENGRHAIIACGKIVRCPDPIPAKGEDKDCKDKDGKDCKKPVDVKPVVIVTPAPKPVDTKPVVIVTPAPKPVDTKPVVIVTPAPKPVEQKPVVIVTPAPKPVESPKPVVIITPAPKPVEQKPVVIVTPSPKPVIVEPKPNPAPGQIGKPEPKPAK